jgi:serine phosphatase RsbU (regulator of sigma subunit)
MHIFLAIIVFVLFALDSLLLLGLGGVGFLSGFTAANTFATSIAILIQLPIFYFIIYKSYIGPVHHLNKEIAKFMTGMQEDIHIEPNSLSHGMNSLTTFFIKSLQILKVFKEELRDGRKLRSEVEIASEIQKHILDKEEVTVPSLEIAMATASATEVGGDSYDIIAGKDGNYYVYVGDVTGHGVPSGFVMMTVNALISALSLNEDNGAKILADTNRILKPRVKQNMMMSCVMLRWDAPHKALYYTGAGHEYILVYKAHEQKVYKVKTGWVALGMVKDSSKILKEQQIAFEPEDVIILYTDGISEARYRSEPTGILFGVDRIVESIMKCGKRDATTIFQQITIDLSAFMGYKHKQYDDITLIVARYLPSSSANAGSGVTMSTLPDAIDFSHVTEWNWWRKASEVS